MAPKTVDIKLKFEQTDMTPGPDGHRWRRDALLRPRDSDFKRATERMDRYVSCCGRERLVHLRNGLCNGHCN